MDPEKLAHWQAADAAFDHWLDLPDSQRDAWLATENLPEPVRRRLVQLITAHQQPRASLDPAGNNLAGCRLGDWTLDTELGRGGMAVVYRAWREDGIARQQAALKILTLGALGATGRERFQREATILARLNHSGITPLIDSGVADDGTCWLAMPLVDGQRIDRWCETHSPDARAIVRLYLQVCGAVAYAHRNLVIHRDIKPSNVLVDDHGHVRLLDFGIGQFADAEGERTQTMWRALTPGYAAPEQLAGAPPGTAVDVYGLGALLHRLLTGRTPQATTESTDTTRPSLLVRSSDDAYHQHYVPLKNDLDRVLLKCLAEEPERRYATAEALADDLRRWLDGQPVLAQKPKPGYRMRKFVMRNKVGVAAGVLLVASLAGGVAATLWQAGEASREAAQARSQAARADREAAKARTEATRAEEVRDFLGQVFASTDPSKGEIPSALDLLEEGARKAREEVLPDDPGAAAEILLLTGYARMHMSEYERATADLEEAQRLFQTHRPEALYQRWRTHMHLSSIHRVQGDLKAARSQVQAAAAINEQRSDVVPDERIITLLTLGNSLTTEDPAAAERVFRQALDQVEQHGFRDSGRHYEALTGLVHVRFLQGLEEDAETTTLMAEVTRLAIALFSGNRNGNYAAMISGLALHLRKDPQRLEEADRLGREAVEIAARVYQAPHVMKTMPYCNYGYQLLHQERPSEALEHFDTGLANARAVGLASVEVFTCLRGRAYGQAMLGRHAKAMTDLDAAFGLLRRLGHLDSKLYREACGLQVSVMLRQVGPAPARRALQRCPSPKLPHESLEWMQAHAELARAEGDRATASATAVDLRARHPPKAGTQAWMRPWMLSLLLAHEAGDADARALLVAALGEHAARAPLSHCLARPDRTSCLAFP